MSSEGGNREYLRHILQETINDEFTKVTKSIQTRSGSSTNVNMDDYQMRTETQAQLQAISFQLSDGIVEQL